MNHKSKILEKLAQRAAIRKEHAATTVDSEENVAPFIGNLQIVFPVNVRKELSSLTNPISANCIEEVQDMRELSYSFMSNGASLTSKFPAELLNRLGRQYFEDDERTRITLFKAVSMSTQKDYARRLSFFLSFCFSIVEDESMRERCGLDMKTVLSFRTLSIIGCKL